MVTHTVAVMIVQAAAADAVWERDPTQARASLRAVEESGRTAMADLRGMLGALRAEASAAERQAKPGIEELSALVDEVRASGLSAQLTVAGSPDAMGAATGLSLLRIAQEAVTNALRHAAASAITIELVVDEDTMSMSIADDGVGYDRRRSGIDSLDPHREGGHGLAGMRERAKVMGGSFEVRSGPDGGTVVTVMAPLGQKAHAMISVLLIDDQELLRSGFRMILETTDDIRVVGQAADGAAGVEAARRLRPDVVLMDIRMGDVDGIEATRRIVAAGAGRVVVLTTFDLDEYVYGALRAGASGFLLKDTRPVDLIEAVRIVARGDALLAPRVTRRLLARFARTSALYRVTGCSRSSQPTSPSVSARCSRYSPAGDPTSRSPMCCTCRRRRSRRTCPTCCASSTCATVCRRSHGHMSTGCPPGPILSATPPRERATFGRADGPHGRCATRRARAGSTHARNHASPRTACAPHPHYAHRGAPDVRPDRRRAHLARAAVPRAVR